MLKRLKLWMSLIFVDHGFFRMMYNNFYPLSGDMYRLSHPSPHKIRKYQAQYGIKTIVNLRGPNKYGSYILEEETCKKQGIELVNIRILSRDVPTKEQIFAFKEMFETITYPAMMHCKSGADRAGIASVLYLVFMHNTPVDEAMKQLARKYGHFKSNKTGILDHFFECYLAFNAHTPTPFLDWVEHHFDRETVAQSFRHDATANILTDKLVGRE